MMSPTVCRILASDKEGKREVSSEKSCLSEAHRALPLTDCVTLGESLTFASSSGKWDENLGSPLRDDAGQRCWLGAGAGAVLAEGMNTCNHHLLYPNTTSQFSKQFQIDYRAEHQ